MPHGYHGRILHANLTTGKMEVEQPPESFYRFYMGGSALGLHYLLKNTPAHADPLGPDNTLILALSVLTGAPISGQSRMTAVAKSPLTDGVGDSQSGGFFPAEMKFAGFDALVITGKAPQPIYLWLHDGQAELRDAAHLWGLITGQAEAAIRQELGDDKIEIAQIGPAGERLVRFAAIMNMSNRANGRNGMGAVMGSKNLKAVAVRGKMHPSLADAKALNALSKAGAQGLEKSGVANLAKFGTANVMASHNKRGFQVSLNWDSGFTQGAEQIGGEAMYDTILRGAVEGKQDRDGRDTCYACTVRCKRVAEIEAESHPVDPHYGGPEFETLAMFGTSCGITDLAAIAYANQLCNQYGMDTMSCGATVAWAFNCYEQGLITAADTGGLELNYGNAEAMISLVEQIGMREGFGQLLGEGSARAAEQVGHGAEDLVVAVKKQEVPAHMPLYKRGLGLIYAVNPGGADHQSSEHDPVYEGGFKYYQERLAQLGLTEEQPRQSLTDEKVRFALVTQYLYSALDSLDICQFVFGPAWHLYGPAELVQAVQAVTGWDVTLDEVMTVGQRRLNMLRAFNAREGIGREADRLPKKFWQPLKGGPTDGMALDPADYERAKDSYYALAGWDVASGTPTQQKLAELGLDWVAEML
jgi:aldehyde:ferredoxin oxidoreductase